MEQVARQLGAAANKEGIHFRDYDCDGICSTLIMTGFLNAVVQKLSLFSSARMMAMESLLIMRRAVDEVLI